MIMKVSGRVFLCGYGGLLVISSSLLFVYGNIHNEEDEWIDPYDMLNYDPVSKSMRKPAEASCYNNVPTKRREYTQDTGQVAQCPDVKECTDKVIRLQREVRSKDRWDNVVLHHFTDEEWKENFRMTRQSFMTLCSMVEGNMAPGEATIEEHRKRVTFSSQQPTCNPVFKRFLAKLLKEIDKLGLPTAVTAEMHYDAEVKLSKQMVAEIQKLVTDESGWRTGALDNALSQILINFKLHDYEAWKWRFEDTFGVEPDTVIKVSLIVLIIAGIICTEMWSVVSWFVQFRRMFAICFFISVVWNWFYLYKIAFAEHQANVAKMMNINDKCTGVKKFDWMDNFKEWFRTTWTLQDDPCMEYYKALLVNPILLVPPTKAITMTITTFITDPLKHLGQGISEFLKALLKDLPITLQIPVLLLIALSIVVFMYSTGQAAVQHVVFRPVRGGRRDPPPGIAQQPAAPPIQDLEEGREEEREQLARGDANRAAQPRHRIGQDGNQVNRVGNWTKRTAGPKFARGDPTDETRREPQRECVETLRSADCGDETDTREEAAAQDQAQHVEEESQTLSHGPKEENEASASNTEVQRTQPASKEHSAKSDSKDNKTAGNPERNELGDSASVGGDASKKEDCVENIGTPVQETVQ